MAGMDHGVALKIDRHTLDSAEQFHEGAGVPMSQPLPGRCKRRAWFQLRWAAHTPPIPPKRLRRMSLGKIIEDEILYSLSRIAIVIARQRHVTLARGWLRGRIDAMIVLGSGQPEKVAEVKSLSREDFDAINARGLFHGRYDHYETLNLYLSAAGKTEGLYIGQCVATGRVLAEEVSLNHAIPQSYGDLVEEIAASPQPPIGLGKPTDFKALCGECPYSGICHDHHSNGDVTGEGTRAMVISNSGHHHKHGNDTTPVVWPRIHCRTCRFAIPTSPMEWVCGLDDAPIGMATQRVGCDRHELISGLIPGRPVKEAEGVYELFNGDIHSTEG